MNTESHNNAMPCYLGLGANIGDKSATIKLAIGEISALPGTTFISQSHLYRSKPWGMTDQDWFVNAVVKIATTLTPLDLLRHLKEIETRLGRKKNSLRWGPRVIDIDILLYADVQLDTEYLVIPHPRMRQRMFVLLPLSEIAPGLALPPDGENIMDCLKKTHDEEAVYLIDDHS